MNYKHSFIIPLRNHLAETQAMFLSLLESFPLGFSYEVIFVDDFSTDDTRLWLEGLVVPNVKVVLNENNRGYAYSTNLGADLASGEMLFLLNNDLVFTSGWMEPMFESLNAQGRRTGLVGNLQYRVTDQFLDHAGVALSESGTFVHKQPTFLPRLPFEKVLAVTGACLLLTKELFDRLGGLDERFFNGCEDIDLCYKARQHGFDVVVSYESKINHHVSLSRGVSSLQNERNSQMLFAKWRKEIKQDLAAVWLPNLQNGAGWDASVLPGALSDDFLASPFTASRIIAESVLCRLEAHWATTVGDEPLTTFDDDIRVSTRGLEKVPGALYYKMSDSVVINVVGQRSARNVYVCGFKVAVDEPREIAVSFEVNGIQKVIHRLAPEQGMNVGVINPLWLSGASNRIEVCFAFVGADGIALGNACSAVYLTHVVVDDQEFHDL